MNKVLDKPQTKLPQDKEAGYDQWAIKKIKDSSQKSEENTKRFSHTEMMEKFNVEH
jgi:hypothetical protein